MPTSPGGDVTAAWRSRDAGADGLDPSAWSTHDAIVEALIILVAASILFLAITIPLWALVFRVPWWPVLTLPWLGATVGAAVGGSLGRSAPCMDVSDCRKAVFRGAGSFAVAAFVAALIATLVARRVRTRG